MGCFLGKGPPGSIVRHRAFTLVEVLLAISIVGVLAALGMPLYEKYRNRTMVAMAVADIKQIEAKLGKYYVFHDSYPATLDEAGAGLIDPWGSSYRYLRMSDFDEKGNSKDKGKPSDGGKKEKVRKDRNLHPINTDYDLYSIGADHKSVAPLTAKPSQDDVIRANNGVFIGLASDY